jgi:hypothetical protein
VTAVTAVSNQTFHKTDIREAFAAWREGNMLAEIFMIWIESLRRHETSERTTMPSTSAFVPFVRSHPGAFKSARPR